VLLRWYVRVSLAALSPGLALQASTIDRDLGLVPPTESPIAACMVAISFACFRWQATDSPDGVGSWLSGIAGCQCEGSGTGARLGARPGPASRTSVSPSNLAWRRESRTFRSAPFTTSHQPVLRIRPESPRSTSDRRSEVLRGGYGGATGISACGQPAVGECDAITPAMPIFILSGICNEMGVSAENSEEPKTRVEHVVSRCLHAACTFLAG
jgi:hypothetical protein